MKDRLKRFGTDIAGYLLILLGLSLGWFPGPGGIPLILAGLGLLSIHNPWARHIMKRLSDGSNVFVQYAFPDDRRAQIAHDIIAILLAATSVWVTIVATSAWHYAIGAVLLVLALTDFCLNRRRLARFRSKS